MEAKIPLVYLICQAVRAKRLHVNCALAENGFSILIEQWTILNELSSSNEITPQDLTTRIKRYFQKPKQKFNFLDTSYSFK